MRFHSGSEPSSPGRRSSGSVSVKLERRSLGGLADQRIVGAEERGLRVLVAAGPRGHPGGLPGTPRFPRSPAAGCAGCPLGPVAARRPPRSGHRSIGRRRREHVRGASAGLPRCSLGGPGVVRGRLRGRRPQFPWRSSRGHRPGFPGCVTSRIHGAGPFHAGCRAAAADFSQ